MKRRVQTVSIALFTFLLVLPGSISAHDDEHQAKGGHGSSDFYEEGSGMKIQSEKNSMHNEHDEYDKHGKSSEHMEEGSGMR